MIWSNDTNRDGMTTMSFLCHMNLEHVLSKGYISLYVYANYDDIIWSCWQIQISVSYDLVSTLI
jgi:hypothetical protein